MSPGLTSNLLLTVPLAVFVFGGLWLWTLLDRWLAEALEGEAP